MHNMVPILYVCKLYNVPNRFVYNIAVRFNRFSKRKYTNMNANVLFLSLSSVGIAVAALCIILRKIWRI